MGWTYIVRCRDDSFYVGSTRSLAWRIYQHNLGKGARYTACRRPVELVWCAEYDNIAEAFALEKQVQGWSRAKRLALIEGRFADLPILAKRHAGGEGIWWLTREQRLGIDASVPPPEPESADG